jgi:hypothetical protein
MQALPILDLKGHLKETRMKKVVYNACYGGFGLSHDALYLLFVMGFPFRASPLAKSGYKVENFPLSTPSGLRAHSDYEVLLMDETIYHVELGHYDPKEVALRSHPILVHVVEKLGARANSRFADLQVQEIGDDDLYAIEEYDGSESVRVMSPSHYVEGFKMSPLAIPDVPWAKALLLSEA